MFTISDLDNIAKTSNEKIRQIYDEAKWKSEPPRMSTGLVEVVLNVALEFCIVELPNQGTKKPR